MRILIGHNRYRWAGGEDAVVKTESALLRSLGHEVQVFEADNDFVRGFQGLMGAKNLFWSKPSYKRLRSVLRAFKPNVAHFHNIYFSLTPSVYDACHDEGVAVVQSLHNFRMFCANALYYRDGHVCEDCSIKSPLEGIKHRCYRDSVIASSAVTAVTAYHRWQRTWIKNVDCYITATEFTRDKYVQGGVPLEKIIVKPNVFCPTHTYKKPRGEYVLYVGRLSEEKGVRFLLQAWEQLPHIPLKLMGDGPLAVELKAYVKQNRLEHIEFLGSVSNDDYNQFMQGAKFIVIPSQCYENFPRIAVEAFAFGLPVLGSRLGSLKEIIVDGETGFCFSHTDSHELKAKAKTMWEMDLLDLSTKVKAIFDVRYSPLVNGQQLVTIYEQAQNLYKNRSN